MNDYPTYWDKRVTLDTIVSSVLIGERQRIAVPNRGGGGDQDDDPHDIDLDDIDMLTVYDGLPAE